MLGTAVHQNIFQHASGFKSIAPCPAANAVEVSGIHHRRPKDFQAFKSNTSSRSTCCRKTKEKSHATVSLEFDELAETIYNEFDILRNIKHSIRPKWVKELSAPK